VTNATDEEYSTGGNSSLTTGSGYAEIAYARPRQYFLTFEWDYQDVTSAHKKGDFGPLVFLCIPERRLQARNRQV